MKRSVWSRVGVGAAVSVLMTMSSGLAHAADDAGDSMSLKIASALRSGRLFGNAGVILVNVKTKSGDTYDASGPVVTRAELENVFTDGSASRDVIVVDPSVTDVAGERAYISDQIRGAQGIQLVTNYLRDNGLAGVGTPPGLKGKASSTLGTAGISLGYFLGDDHNWAVETYVLAAPLSTSVSVRGTTTRINETRGSGEVTRPIAINGQKIITSKLLPPTALFGYYFGNKEARFRPYVGGMAMYAIFMDTKATQTLNNYVGGTNPGDTTVSLKNAFGAGPVIGLRYQIADKWHASFNIGSVKLKTQATLVTRNTNITSDSAIVRDLGPISDRLATGENVYASPTSSACTDTLTCETIKNLNGGLTSLVMKGVMADRGTDNLGTFVRKTDTTLTNTIFMLSVGRSF